MGEMLVRLAGFLAAGVAIAVLGCAGSGIPLHKRNVALWATASAEYAAVTLQTYATAREKLDAALADPAWTALLEQTEGYVGLPPAIIVDLDETVLDNRPFQMRLIREKREFDEEMWKEWVRLSRVEAVPGAVEFLQYAHEQRVEVFYVTNRTHDVEDATRENLRLLELPLNPEIDTLLTKNEQPDWGKDKESRRQLIASSYRVLLIIGDNLDDFTRAKGFARVVRRQTALEYSPMWGEKWFMLPNPLYGSWVAATRPDDESLE